MGNSKNKKVPKKRKALNTSKCNTSSDQKENVPKTQKTRNNKPDPDEGIAMSKQLLLKKNKLRTQRRSSKPERICANGKPMPSLSELKKRYEDSDDDDQTPKTPSKQSPCATSTPEKGIHTSVSKNNLLSPTAINKISQQLLGSIQEQKFPDLSEVLDATSLLREKSPPPLPIIPPKKRKKTEIPYIVGCKDRPKVICKPSTNFCKGDDDYGVEASSEDPEEPKPAKRGKKSRIPNYSKSIFNAHSDEIAERLAKDDAADLSDASSDSNKTIEYEPTLIQTLRPQSFSPIPSTSRDSETFKKNDELFNKSLKATQITKDISKKNDELIDKSLKEINIPKEITIKEEDEQMTNALTPKKREDGVSIYKKSSPINKGDDDVQIIEIPYDTIDIDDTCESTVSKKNIRTIIDNSVIEIIEPAGLEDAKPENKAEIPNDEDCMIVSNSGTINNYNNCHLNEPIVIDDEYSTINTEFDSFNNEPIEIIDVDDIIAENNSILDKWKNSQETKKMTTYSNVIEVQATVAPSTTVQRTSTQRTTLQASVTPSNTLQASLTSGTTLQASLPPSNTLQASLTPGTTVQASLTPATTLQASLTSGTTLQPSVTPSTTLQANLARNTAVPSTPSQRSGAKKTPSFQRILDDFFTEQLTRSCPESRTSGITNPTALFLKALAHSFTKSATPMNTTTPTTTTPMNNYIPVPTNTSQNAVDRPSNRVTTQLSSNSGTTITNVPPASQVPQRNIGDCPICLDPLSSSNGIASTICGHVFCLTCIQASVKSSGKKCPTCRKALKGAGYHQLYL